MEFTLTVENLEITEKHKKEIKITFSPEIISINNLVYFLQVFSLDTFCVV